jgi:4a-hydroxytetrahydrobiopterin dehydratase
MAELADDPTITSALQSLDGWRREGDELVCDREFEDFAAALRFVNAVGERAEAANHHPDIRIHGWNKVELRLSTHSAGGITPADLDMAGTLASIGS